MKFEISEKSMEIYRNWKKEHDRSCPYLKTGAAGGRISFCHISSDRTQRQMDY